MSNKKPFLLFDMNRNGRGVPKNEPKLKPTLGNLPKIFYRKFTKLLSLNFMMLPIWLLPLAEAWLYVTAPTMPSQTHGAFSSVFGIGTIAQSPAIASLQGILGFQLGLQTYDKLRYFVAGLLLIVLALIWGWINVGVTYITREMFKGEAVFIWSDFWYAVKKNLWQGLWLGLIDFFCSAMLIYDLFFFGTRGGTFGLDFMFFALCAVVLIYMFMRYYMYLILVTFNIKTLKLLKNSLIFSILGIKRNLLSFFAVFVVLLLNAALIVLFWSVGIAWVAIPLILPLIYLLPTLKFFKTYGAYPVIEKYMIN